jgi:hypothetical protein
MINTGFLVLRSTLLEVLPKKVFAMMPFPLLLWDNSIFGQFVGFR